MIPKLTLDGGLLRELSLLPAIRTLKTWESEGKIEIFEADRAKEAPTGQQGWPGGTPPARLSPRHRTIKRTEKNGLSFQRVCGVLFPNRDSHRLNMTEVNDVVHLLRHLTLGHFIFVTNAPSFIAEGKREKLQAAFRTVILTPEETVIALKETEPWDDTTEKEATK